MKNNANLIHGIILLGLIYLFLTILQPFLASIVMALVFAIVFCPVFEKIQKSFRSKDGLAAFVTVLLTLFIIIIPIIVLLGMIGQQAVNFLQDFDLENAQAFFKNNQSFTIFNYEINLAEQQEKILASLQSVSVFIANQAASIIGLVLNSVSMFFVFLLLYFYFLKDKVQLLESVQKAIPYDAKQSKALMQQFHSISKTVFFAITGAAFVSGVFAAIGFHFFGLGSPLIWGLLVGLFSLIPTVGSLFVYLLGAVVAFYVGGWQTALGLAVFYTVFELVINENIIKPKLLDDRLAIHPILVFFAIVGGVNAFGAMGILYGPIVVVLLGSIYQFSTK